MRKLKITLILCANKTNSKKLDISVVTKPMCNEMTKSLDDWWVWRNDGVLLVVVMRSFVAEWSAKLSCCCWCFAYWVMVKRKLLCAFFAKSAYWVWAEEFLVAERLRFWRQHNWRSFCYWVFWYCRCWCMLLVLYFEGWLNNRCGDLRCKKGVIVHWWEYL